MDVEDPMCVEVKPNYSVVEQIFRETQGQAGVKIIAIGIMSQDAVCVDLGGTLKIFSLPTFGVSFIWPIQW